MTTSVSELMAEEWRQTHPYPVEVVCPCGEAWMTTWLTGDPLDEGSMYCSECGERGEPQ